MAKFNPPDSFAFDRPNEWGDWKQRFQRYRLATKLNKEDGEVQVSSLIYAMGPEAENIFKSFTLSEDDQKKFDVVLGKYDGYFYPKRNVIHERACFHLRVQRPGEKVEMFIRALYDLSEHCDFGAIKDEHIRDRIVVGILDKDLSRKLQLEAGLTLTQTIQTVRQSEEVTTQVHQQQGEACTALQEIARGRGKPAYRGKPHWKNKRESGEHGAPKCGRCGKMQHKDQERCPALKSTCNKCKKVGHWEIKCHTKAIREVTETETVSQTPYFLGAVTNANRDNDQWTVQILMEEETFNMLFPQQKVLQSNIPPMSSPGGQLICLGKFQATLLTTSSLWHENASGSSRRKLLMLLGRGKFGALSWSCCPRDPTPDKRLKMDGWMDG